MHKQGLTDNCYCVCVCVYLNLFDLFDDQLLIGTHLLDVAGYACMCIILYRICIVDICVCYSTAYESVPQSGSDNSPLIIYVNRQKSTPPRQEESPDINHLFHCIICFLFPPWLFVWLCLCYMYYVDY